MLLTVLIALIPAALPGEGGGEIAFEPLDPGAAGFAYTRTATSRFSGFEALQLGSLEQPLAATDAPRFPGRIFGIPGVAIFDFDRDDDLDIYVTNSPGTANSLFVNQLDATGELTFVDRALEAGVDATDMESSGACFGDLDNDGDQDLLVLGFNEPNRLFENLGDGRFVVAGASGLEAADTASTSCTMGDIDGDGRLDVFIGNAWDQSSLLAIFAEPFAFNHPNELFRNDGGLAFTDVSDTSGIRRFTSLPPGVATITWSTAFVDLDRDGDIDLVHADDQGAFPIARDGGIDRGLMQVFTNDGSGNFTNRPIQLDEQAAGSWMGVAVGDLNCDGHLDLMGSNFGDYGIPSFGGAYTLGDQSTRWFYGNGDGSFNEPGLENLVSSAFGWGNAIADFDLDGDQDMIYLGGLLVGLLAITDNPGVVLVNRGCGARYELLENAFAVDYRRHGIAGVAIGDLDRDQRPDLVAAASFEIPEALPLLAPPVAYGGPFDAFAAFAPNFVPTPAGFVWAGVQAVGGTLHIERNASSGRGVTVELMGSVGLTARGRVNRDGIGALVDFRPRRGDRVSFPIQGGSSHVSQHASEAYFGLGGARKGTLEVLWPGGVRNRLYNVRAGENLRVPEIPCSFDAEGQGFGSYLRCVLPALVDLRHQGAISRPLTGRLLSSAIRAFFDPR